MSRLRKVLADDFLNDKEIDDLLAPEKPKANPEPEKKAPQKSDIEIIESNPDHGKVVWSCLNTNGKGGYVSYNSLDKTFYCFQNYDEEGLTDPGDKVKLNKKSPKDQFEVAKKKVSKLTTIYISGTNGFTEKQIIPLDKLFGKRPDEERSKGTPLNPSQVLTVYAPEGTGGHIYILGYDTKLNSFVAQNNDGGADVAVIQSDPLEAQTGFDKAEKNIIDCIGKDATFYRRDIKQDPIKLGLQMDIEASPWGKFDMQQQKEKQKKQEEDQKMKEKEQENKPAEQPQPQQENPPAQQPSQQPPQPAPQTDNKKKDDHRNPNKTRNVEFGGFRTIEVVFKGKDHPAIYKLVADLKQHGFSPASEILPMYSYKKSSRMSLNRILTALNILNCRVSQSTDKIAAMNKMAVFTRKSRLRKSAYVYTEILRQLADELVTNVQNSSVSSVYFAQDTDDASNSSACGFIVKSGNSFLAFGPNAGDDIVTIDTQIINEMRQNDPAADVNAPKMTLDAFVSKVQEMKPGSIQVFNSAEEAETWINQVNGNQVKGRVVLKDSSNFPKNEHWDNIDELGENPDLKPEDIKKPEPQKTEPEPEPKKQEEKPKTDQDKWYDTPEDERVWKLRLTYKNNTSAVNIIRDWLSNNSDVVMKGSYVLI